MKKPKEYTSWEETPLLFHYYLVSISTPLSLVALICQYSLVREVITPWLLVNYIVNFVLLFSAFYCLLKKR